MTYEKAWKKYKKELEKDIAYLKKEIEKLNGKENEKLSGKYEAMSILYHRMNETETTYPLEEKERERLKFEDEKIKK